MLANVSIRYLANVLLAMAALFSQIQHYGVQLVYVCFAVCLQFTVKKVAQDDPSGKFKMAVHDLV